MPFPCGPSGAPDPYQAVIAQLTALQKQVAQLQLVLGTTLPALNPNGATDRGPDFSAAATAAGLGGAVVLAPGSYSLNSQPNVYGVGFFGVGAKLTGGSGLPGVTDAGALANSNFFASKLMVNAGTATVGSANENVFYFSASLSPTSAAAGYQKNVKYTTLQHGDASTYSSPGDGISAAVPIVTKDGVGDDVQVGITPGNMTARLFGRDTIVSIPSGSDGAVAGHEYKIVNFGSASSLFATSTSKHALNIFVDGTADIVTCLYTDIAVGSTARYTYGWFATRQAIATDLLNYRQSGASNAQVYARITRDGRALFNGGIGVGNLTGTTSAPGAIVNKMPIYDMNQNLIGYVPIYAS